ncbi:MAG TPA: MoaD/ThiS family protein [Dehalococcoidia bacterium]|nr:MoaD/ThiS family protein [Dehalococcoidia bacterium]
MSLNIKIIPFAFYRELMERREVEITIAKGATLADLKEALDRTFPRFKDYLPLMAINGEMKPLHAPLKEGDEVALLPPFSGGACG